MNRNPIASTVVQSTVIVCLMSACNGGGGGEIEESHPAEGGGEVRSAKAVSLEVPRQPSEHEMVHVRVPVGKLEKGTQIRVLTSTGELAGTVSPFGIQAAAAGGVYSIAIPAAELADDRIDLVLELKERDGGKKRAPTDAEVGEIEILFVPVSKVPEKE